LLTALALLLLTPLSDQPSAVQAPLGGIRSYALVVILPALHWCFELSEKSDRPRPGGWARWGLLGAQLPILALGGLVRGGPLYLAVPLLAHAGLALRRMGKGRWRRTAAVLLTPAASLFVGIEATGRLGFPDYVAGGRAFVTIWHHAFLGLGVNPEWPYPKVRE